MLVLIVIWWASTWHLWVFSSAWDFQGLSAFTWGFYCLSRTSARAVFPPRVCILLFPRADRCEGPGRPLLAKAVQGCGHCADSQEDLLPGRLASFCASFSPVCLPLSLTWLLPSFCSFLMSFIRLISLRPFLEVPGEIFMQFNPCFLQFGVTHVHLSVVHWWISDLPKILILAWPESTGVGGGGLGY